MYDEESHILKTRDSSSAAQTQNDSMRLQDLERFRCAFAQKAIEFALNFTLKMPGLLFSNVFEIVVFFVGGKAVRLEDAHLPVAGEGKAIDGEWQPGEKWRNWIFRQAKEIG